MIDTSMSGIVYNRFDNLDTIEDRIIYYLLSDKNKTDQELEQVHNIWRILYYNDEDALIDDDQHPLPKYSDIVKLIYNDNGSQSEHRIFRSPHVEDSWNKECTLIKVYVDSIIPKNHIASLVNVGIDVLVNTKIINLTIPDEEINVNIDKVDGIAVSPQTKSRVTTMVKAILSLLNGADIAGIGRMIFSNEQSIYNKAQYGLWNNRNFEGMKMVIGVYMSGVN